MKATAIIPARGGSRGIPRKNLRTVGGVPLVVRTVRAALAAEGIDMVIVSTDDPEIAAVARREGAKVHERGLMYSGPDVTVAQVVALVVENYSLEPEDGPVVVLQPTSPFTDARLIDAVLAELENADSVETVTSHRHALFDPAGRPMHFLAVNRQTAPVTAWVPTGAVRAMRTFPAEGGPVSGAPMVGETHTLFDPADEFGLTGVAAERYALDVDSPADFAVARDLASRGRILFVIAVGTDTGSGHLHRCLTLADELSQHEIEFDFAWAEAEWAKEMVEARGYRMAYDGPDVRPDVYVYDCLEEVTAGDVLMGQARGSRVVVLECLDADVVAQADLAVNSLYTGPSPALCGPMWEPLRPEFAVGADRDDVAGQANDPKGRVLISFGGTDPSHLTEWAAGYLSDLYAEVRVLWPPGREMAEPLGLPEGVAVQGGSVSDALAWADVVVTSAGRTVLEAAAMSCPTVAICAHEREEHHAPLPGVMWLGHHARLDGNEVVRLVRHLLDRPEEREARGARMRAAVNPAGAAVRLAAMIDSLARR